MNDEKATCTPLTEKEQAEAERLLQAFLDECPPDAVPLLRTTVSLRAASHVYKDLLPAIFYAYHEGWDDGYFDGRADARALNDSEGPFYEGREDE